MQYLLSQEEYDEFQKLRAAKMSGDKLADYKMKIGSVLVKYLQSSRPHYPHIGSITDHPLVNAIRDIEV